MQVKLDGVRFSALRGNSGGRLTVSSLRLLTYPPGILRQNHAA